WIALGTRRDLIDISTRSVLIFAGGILVSVYVIAFFYTVLFEAPLFHLLEYLKNGPAASSRQVSLEMVVDKMGEVKGQRDANGSNGGVVMVQEMEDVK